MSVQSRGTSAVTLFIRQPMGALAAATLACLAAAVGHAAAPNSTASPTMTTNAATATTSGTKAPAAATPAPGSTSGTKAPAAVTPAPGSPGGTKAPAATPPAPQPAAASFPDPSGAWANFPAGAPDQANAFFKALGSNVRTCGTCHDPKDGWTVTPGNLHKRFTATGGADPVFLNLDGTNCPTLPTATLAQKQSASSLLLNKGLIRVALAVPATADFKVSTVSNPYGCSSTTTVSVYRRVLSTTNLVFLSDVMWDGRETTVGASFYTDLVHQANDAVATHAAGTVAAPAASIQAAVALEMEQFTAQVTDTKAGALNAAGGKGGPAMLSAQAYAPGENTGTPPQPAFTVYAAWETLVPASNASTAVLAQASIGRGEKIFNTRAISITGVGGLNDIASQGGVVRSVITGTCSTCHNSPNAGNSSKGLMLNEGQAHVSLRTPDLPLITLSHKSDGKLWQVTDPGAALATGKWADVGKFKVPTLRGLAARAPYFHNGSAASLDQVVGFYNTRFNLNLSSQEHTDLVNFLGAL